MSLSLDNSASEMTCIASSGVLNSTHSLTLLDNQNIEDSMHHYHGKISN